MEKVLREVRQEIMIGKREREKLRKQGEESGEASRGAGCEDFEAADHA